MLKIIKSLISPSEPVSEGPAEEDRIVVATCVLLLEMARSDGEFHGMEALVVEDLLARKFDMPPEARKELIELAEEKSDASIDLHRFTRQINESFTEGEKLQVVRTLWRIVYADGVFDKYEDFLMRRLVTLLRLSHRQMIEAKVRVLDEVGRENVRPGD
jgi:uncharacterized tellurite resistance protein B-like protein